MSKFDGLGAIPINKNTSNSKFDGLDAVPIQEYSTRGNYRFRKNIPNKYRDFNESKIEYSTLDRAKEFGQGVASGIGGLADLANKGVGAGVAHSTGYLADSLANGANMVGLDSLSQGVKNIGNKAHELGNEYWNSNLSEQLPNSKILQTNKPEDKFSKVLKTSGDVSTAVIPFTGVSKGLKVANDSFNAVKVIGKNGVSLKYPWLDNLNKVLAGTKLKDAGSFAAMGAGGELAKSDNPETSALENSAREVAGGIFAGVAVPLAMRGVASKVANVFTKDASKKLTSAEKKFIKEYSGELDKTVVDSAKKLELPLTPDLISNNQEAQFLIRNRLESSFANKSFVAMKEGFNPKVVKALEDNLFNVIGSDLKDDISKIGNSYIKDTFMANKKYSKELYEKAKSLAKEELVYPKKSIIEAEKIIKDLSYGSKKDTSSGKAKTVDTLKEFVEAAKNGFGIRDAHAWVRDLKSIPTEQLGSKDTLNLLTSVGKNITNEIDHMVKSGAIKDNAPLVKAWNIATEYNKNNIQTWKQISIVKDLMNPNKVPKDILEFMKNKRGVTEMEPLFRDNKDLWQSLKRISLGKAFKDKRIINSEGEVSATKFIDFLDREKDYAISLMGKKQYELTEKYFLPYFKKLKSLGKNINYSRTAPTAADINLKKEATGVFSKKTLGDSAAGAAAGALGGKAFGMSGPAAIGGATIGAYNSLRTTMRAKNEINIIKELSRIASDEKILKEMIKYMEKQVPLNQRISNFTKSITKENINKAAQKGVQKLSDNPILQRQLLLLNKSDDFEKASVKGLRDFSNSKALKTFNEYTGGDILSRDKYYK